MSRELMQTIGVSLTSSLCTAMFVVACTAAATDGEKVGEGGGAGGDGSSDDGGGPGAGDDGDGMSAADLAALEARVLALEDFKSSSLCFISHMTDDQRWRYESGEWGWDTDTNHGWDQGSNSDAQQAYDDCF